jgi:putative DNA primase/helicase
MATTSTNHRTKAEIDRSPQRPVAPPPNLDGIPDELKERDQWVCWRYVFRDGKWTKVPIDAQTGGPAESDNPQTWASFGEAVAYYQAHRDRVDGIGYVFVEGDPYTGLDFDDCLGPDGQLAEWARPHVKRLASFTDISPSDRGVKVFTRATKPGDRCRTGDFECYSHERFFTLTGRPLPDMPTEIHDRQKEVEAIYDHFFPKKAGQKAAGGGPAVGASPRSDDEALELALANYDGFRELWDGDTTGYDSMSEATMGLLRRLGWATDYDRRAMDRLFRRSKLMRPKWDEKRRESTWGAGQIEEIIATRDEYPPPRKVTLTTDAGPPLFRFRITSARRTKGGTLKVGVDVLRDGTKVNQFTLSDSMNGRKEAARFLAQLNHEAGREKIDAALTGLILKAAESLDRPKAQGDGGQLIASVVAGLVPERLGLKARTERGVWSETLGQEMTRPQFVGYTPGWLLDAAAEAADAPRDDNGIVNRLALHRAIETERKILWSDLQGELEPAAKAKLGENTAAGRRFREAMVKLWTKTMTFEVAKTLEGTSGEKVAARASLISRVQTQAEQFLNGLRKPTPRECRWTPIQKAFAGWWRPYVREDGAVVIYLAMRDRLCAQVGVDLPGVTDQTSLTYLGEQFGVLDAALPDAVKTRLTGGVRLAVLSLELTIELLDDPASLEPDKPAEAKASDTVAGDTPSPDQKSRAETGQSDTVTPEPMSPDEEFPRW